MVSVALLVCACGNSESGASSGGFAGSSGSASRGSEQGGSGSGGSGSGGAAGQGSGGALPKPCKVVDGKLSYGPIGPALPWRLTGSPATDDCPSCGQVLSYSAFRSSAGYGVMWSESVASASDSNLFSMTVGSNFEGGERRALVAKKTFRLDVAAALHGFVVTTCPSNSEPEWLFLNDNLEAAASRTFVAKGASCLNDVPPVLWTGQRYLTAFTDARGLVLASLDEQGALVTEQVLAAGEAQPVQASFSKNADRVLFVFKQRSAGQLRSGVFDLLGAPLGEVQPFGEEVYESAGVAIAPRGDGWWVIGDSGSVAANTGKLTAFSRDGVALQMTRDLGFFSVETFRPSPYGGSLLIGRLSEGGPFAHTFASMALIKDDGQVVYSTERDIASKAVGAWPMAGVADPPRDLVLELQRTVEGGERPMVVQEYGCLE